LKGSKLVGTGAVGIAQQGYSVALSADGNTAIVGGDFDNIGAGATWVCLLKTPKGRESLEIFAPPPYRRGHDHNSFRPRFPALVSVFAAAPHWSLSSSPCDIR
jgi:hypothetical protein